MNRGSQEVSSLFRLSFGDHFVIGTTCEQRYTALLSFHADDRSGVRMVCLAGHRDMDEIAISPGEEIYLDITVLPDNSMMMEMLDGEDREELEQKFSTFLLLLAAERVTTSEQPRHLVDDTWVMRVKGIEISCRKVVSLHYGEIGEYTAHLFIGSEEVDDDEIVDVYLVFLEETESDPLRFEAIDEEAREKIYENLMDTLGYAKELDDPDTESNDTLEC